MAEAYYGENATDPQAVGSVSVSRYDDLGNELRAGEKLTLRISYNLEAAPTFDYGNGALPLFDFYKDTKIKIKLPEGISITKQDGDGTLSGVGSYAEDPENPGTWILTLEYGSISAQSGRNGSFSVNLLLEGNGTLEIGKTFSFDNDMVSLETTFTVLDKSTDPYTDGKSYTKEETGSSEIDAVKTVSDDEWTLSKSYISPYDVSADGASVTVRFRIAVGLRGEDGSVISDPQTYGRNGQVPFEAISLTENLQVKNREGKEIHPDSITVTPQFGSQTGTTFTEGQAVTIQTDTCGAHNISGVDASAPYYSVYLVDVVYPYEDFIADYSDKNQEPLTVNNEAVLNYQLKSGSSKTQSAEAEAEVGEVTKPAALTVEKYITDAGGNSSKLYAGSGWNPVSGAAVFSIQGEGESPLLCIRRMRTVPIRRLSQTVK